MKRNVALALLVTAIVALTVVLIPTALTKRGEAKAPKRGRVSRSNASFLRNREPGSADQSEEFVSRQPEAFGITPAIRDLAQQPESKGSVDAEKRKSEREREGRSEEKNLNERVKFPIPGAGAGYGEFLDPLLALSGGPNAPQAMPTPSLTFLGQIATESLCGCLPPDTNGDVGPNHYMQAVNTTISIYNKSGTRLLGPSLQSATFFAGLPAGNACRVADDGDPIVLYDPLADRWLISQFAVGSAPGHQCVAISQTSDPTGAYFAYDFLMPSTDFQDYPHLGVWPDGYYMTTNQFNQAGTAFLGAGIFAFNRAKMLVGDSTASYIYKNVFTIDPNAGGMLPTDFDGLVPPPAGLPNRVMEFRADEFGDPLDAIRIYELVPNYTTPASSTFTVRSDLALAPFDARQPAFPASRTSIEQSGGAGLDSIADRLMHRLAYRNLGTSASPANSWVGNFTVNVSGVNPIASASYQTGVRWYELRSADAATLPTVRDQGTQNVAPGNGATGINNWMGSAAQDNQGNIALGFSNSSTTQMANIQIAGRTGAGTGGGLNEGEALFFAAAGSQTSASGRWGDYSGMTVDPVDECSFWYTQEYYAATSDAGWSTRIGKFKFPACTSPAMGTLSGAITYCETGQPASGALVQVSDGHSSTVLANGSYSIKLAPGTYTVRAAGAKLSCADSAPMMVTITNGGTSTFNICLSGSPKPSVSSTVVSGGNGNGVIDRNECNSLNVTLADIGCAGLTGASAVLSTSTPGVAIAQANSPYPNIPIGATGTNTVPFSVSTSSTFACGPINFVLTVNSNQGTFTVNFSLPTCPAPPATVTGSITGTDAQQTGRLFRDGVTATCAAPKVFPGLFDSTVRRFDSYTFVNGPADTCVTFDVTSGCGTNLFYAAYLDSYNPANLSQNYLGDPGLSFLGTATWSVPVPANHSVVLVIHEVTANSGCASYSATVSGLVSTAGGPGPCAIPMFDAAGSTLATESCLPSNGVIDPGEQITLSLKIMNTGGASTSNLVGTLLTGGGVVAPSGPQNYGAVAPGGMTARNFSFTASGSCGGTITARMQLQDGATNLGTVTYNFTLGVQNTITVFSENFDGVIAPALPAGWTTGATGAESPWVTSTTTPFSAPNDAFAPDPSSIGNTELVTPTITVATGGQLTFKNNYATELGFDGMVLEISINGGAYQDILAAGGSFVTGGYNATISTAFGSPIAGRMAWSGTSGGYVTSTINLPAAANGQNVRLKWRMASDDGVPSTGVQIDNIVITSTSYTCCSAAPAANVQLSAANYNVGEGDGSVQITVTRTGDTSGSSTVDFVTGNNTFAPCSPADPNNVPGVATQNCDFTVSSGRLTFNATQTSQMFSVPITEDAFVEGNETFPVTLNNVTGAILTSPSTATVTIIDNDGSGPSIPRKRFMAALDGAQETPPTCLPPANCPSGSGMVLLNSSDTSALVGLKFSNLSGPETAAHIHTGAVGVAGPITFTLPTTNPVTDFSIVPIASQVTDLKAGSQYMNVHSSNFSGGEIRGQLLWNPTLEMPFFIRQHYLDFLNREPDTGGLLFWLSQINCPPPAPGNPPYDQANVQCFHDRTVGVSDQFYFSGEFQLTSSFVFLAYRAAYGNTQPRPNPDGGPEANKLPDYDVFMADRPRVLGGASLAQQQLAFTSLFVSRPEFTSRYGAALNTGALFVDAVLANIQASDGVALSSQRQTLIDQYNSGGGGDAGRAMVLWHLSNDYWTTCAGAAPCVPAGFGAPVDNRAFIDANYNRFFALVLYFGYLRRNPEIGGFLFWQDAINQAPVRNQARQIALVCSFVTSGEYQARFGPFLTFGNGFLFPRTNAECP
jgi:hypothetical protein